MSTPLRTPANDDAPELPSMLGKYGHIQTPTGPYTYEVIGEAGILQNPEKAVLIQRIRWLIDDTEEIKLCWYYRKDGHWKASRSPPMTPVQDFQRLLALAEAQGLLLF